MVGVRTETPGGEYIEGSGLVLTSDGLVVTLAELVPQGSDFSFFIDGKKVHFQILTRKEGLSLIKIEKDNLPTVSFASPEKLKLGERVFLVGIIFDEKSNPQEIVNEGIVKFFDKNFIKTNIFEKQTLTGSPLFDIEGNLLGINTIDKEGKVIAIPISKIRQSLNF